MMKQAQINNVNHGAQEVSEGMDAKAMMGLTVSKPKIGKDEINKARGILDNYKTGKTNLENRIVDDELWYRIRHWELLNRNSGNAEENKTDKIQPKSAWLFNAIANKHADAMDSFPEANILPREEGDTSEAEALTSIIPVILEQNDFEETYDKVWNYKLKTGTGVYGIFWNPRKLNGLGDIDIKKIDILNLYWEPGITDIQKSQNLFHVELIDNEILENEYPNLAGKLGTSDLNVTKYIYDESIDTSNKSAVVDWYYKKTSKTGKSILHYCKFVNDEVLFATENEMGEENGEETEPKGLYDHGEYPFVFDVLFPVEGSPAGFGYIDIGKSTQEYIDRGNQAIMQNMLANTRPRHFIRDDGGVNENEYADLTKDFVHVKGSITQDSVQPIIGKPLSPAYITVINNKIDELKETTGNRDISTGGTSSGVTAASAIAAMQEAGSKLSRDANKSSYRSFRKLVVFMIELIRQFYNLPRWFRILGKNGEYNFIQYSNSGIAYQNQGEMFGVEMGMRIPLFDVEITAQKQSPYTKMSQNELALQFYNAGFFNPNRMVEALACLEMMDFNRKDYVIQKIQRNGSMMQQMLDLARMVDEMHGTTEVTEDIIQRYGLEVSGESFQTVGNQGNNTIEGDESGITKNARRRVAEATEPR